MEHQEILTFVKENQSAVEQALVLLKNKQAYAGDNAENIRIFLLQEHGIAITDEQVENIRAIQTGGIILFPVVVTAEQIHKRIVDKIGEAYNHPKDKKVSINTAVGFDRRTSRIYILGVKDSLQPDTDLLISWNKLTTEKSEVDVLRITEYMHLYDYVLVTRNQKLDINSWTRTATPYACSEYIASGYTCGGKFELGNYVRSNDHTSGGFREVSTILIL